MAVAFIDRRMFDAAKCIVGNVNGERLHDYADNDGQA